MPQHYPGNVTYQKDVKFAPISLRNVFDYIILHDDGEFAYMVDPGKTTGYVFDINDLRKDVQHVLPVMRLSLRDTNINGFKQAHFLRIREGYSENIIKPTWYNYYVKMFGGIICDDGKLMDIPTTAIQFLTQVSSTDLVAISFIAVVVFLWLLWYFYGWYQSSN